MGFSFSPSEPEPVRGLKKLIEVLSEKVFSHSLRQKKMFDNILAIVKLGLNALLRHQYKKFINKNNQTVINLLISKSDI